MLIALYVFAALASLLQVFDVVSTNLVISKSRGHEANGLVAKLMGWLGGFWWVYKIPVVAVFAAIAYFQPGWPAVGVLALISAVYAYAVVNNYRVAWRQI